LCLAVECQQSPSVESVDLSRASAGRRVAVLKTHSTHRDGVAAFAFAIPVREGRAVWRSAKAKHLQLAEFLAGELQFLHESISHELN
jgi:hypothetical protein